MDGVIVDNQTEREPVRDLVVNRLKELAELYRPMAMKPWNHSTSLEVERRKQVCRPSFCGEVASL